MKRIWNLTKLFALAVATIFTLSCQDRVLNTTAAVDNPNDLKPLTEEGTELAFQLFTVTTVTDAQAYKLEIASDILFTDILYSRIDYPGPQLAGSATLEAGTTYYWRASVRKDGTWGYPTEGRSFRMADSFEGLSPADGGGTSDTTPLLSWDGVTDADGYELQVSENEEEITSVELIECSTNGYQLSVILNEGDSRFWRVRAKNGDSARTGWSPVLSFTLYQIPTDGLVAEYLFNSNPDDTSGNDNHGIEYGATLTSDRSGNENSAYSLDGFDDYLDFVDPLVNVGEDFTISIWYLKDEDTNEALYAGTVGLDSFGTGGGFGFGNTVGASVPATVDLSTSEQYGQFTMSTAKRQGLNIRFDMPSGWTHYAASYDGQTIRIFIDGIRIADESYTSGWRDNGFGFKVGESNSYTSNYRRANTGSVDDLRIYNRALTETEVLSLYGNEASVLPEDDSNNTQSSDGWTTLLYDDFEDGNYTGGTVWTSEGSDGYNISVVSVNGNYMLKVPRGSDYGWATSPVNIGDRDFRITWDFQRFGDSLGRPWVNLFDDSGLPAFRAYANSWNGGLNILAFEYDASGDNATSEIIAQTPYSDATGIHNFVFLREGSTYSFYMDGSLEVSGVYTQSSVWNDNLTQIGLYGHGSGSSSGAYFDNVKVEIKN